MEDPTRKRPPGPLDVLLGGGGGSTKKGKPEVTPEQKEGIIRAHMLSAGWSWDGVLPSVIVFSSKSAPKPLPATPYENVAPGDSFDALSSAYPNFRRMLSNFCVPVDGLPFTWQGRKYLTVEHAWHAAKFLYDGASAATTAHAQTFEVDSGSLWARDPGKAKSAGGKGGSARAGAVMDPSWPARQPKTTGEIQVAFYNVHAEERNMLKMTAPAFLLHLVRGSPAGYIPWTTVMNYRDTLAQPPRPTDRV